MTSTIETLASLNAAIAQQNRLDDLLKRVSRQFDIQIDIHEPLQQTYPHQSSSLSKSQINRVGLQQFLSKPANNPQQPVTQTELHHNDSAKRINRSILMSSASPIPPSAISTTTETNSGSFQTEKKQEEDLLLQASLYSKTSSTLDFPGVSSHSLCSTPAPSSVSTISSSQGHHLSPTPPTSHHMQDASSDMRFQILKSPHTYERYCLSGSESYSESHTHFTKWKLPPKAESFEDMEDYVRTETDKLLHNHSIHPG